MNAWYMTELNLLCDRYKDTTREELIALLPRHSPKSIACKASYLGLKKSRAHLTATRRKSVRLYMDRTSKKPMVQAFRKAGRLLDSNDHLRALDCIVEGLSTY
jgi:hypothetical protein